jgi:AraC family transcriptional regulator
MQKLVPELASRQPQRFHEPTGWITDSGNAVTTSVPSVGVSTINRTVSVLSTCSIKRQSVGCCAWLSETLDVPPGEEFRLVYHHSAHLLILYHEGAGRDVETRIDESVSSGLIQTFNMLTFVPAGCRLLHWHESDAPTRITLLYIEPSAFLRPQTAFAPRIHFTDPAVWETAYKLKATIEGSKSDTRYLKALSDVLAYELSQTYTGIKKEKSIVRGGLAAWQKRVTVAYINDHLGKGICLKELADLARLSPHHFCRAFKQSFGLPPHQYQVQRRIEAAKQLLEGQTTPITDVALDLGYAQTSSFSTAFRKATGWTPTAYRRRFERSTSIQERQA